MIGFYIALAVVLVLLVLLVRLAIRIVREYQRIVLFRLGRSLGTRGPGLVLIIPVVDRPVLVDLREQYLEIPRQTAITADNSANSSYAYDGLLTTALKPGSSAYVNIMPTGTAGTGTPLTASGRGSVVEIDTMFQKMWDGFQLSPTVLYVNSQELKNITSKVLSNASGPLLRFDSPADGSGGEYQVTASGVVQFYIHFQGVDDLLVGTMREPGALLGWSVFREPYRYTVTTRCEEDCQVMRLPREIIMELVQTQQSLGCLLLIRVAATLANRLEQTRDILVRPAASGGMPKAGA